LELETKLRHKPIYFSKLKLNKDSRKLKAHNTNTRTPNEHEFGWFKKFDAI